jgi:hypothetical protein
MKGYISKVDESSFAITDKKSGLTTTISYADAQRVRGPGLSQGAKIVIVSAVVVGVVALAVVVFIHEVNSGGGLYGPI